MIEHKRDNTLRNDKCKENRVLSSRQNDYQALTNQKVSAFLFFP